MKAYNHYEENTFFEYPRVFKDHENEIIEIIKNIGTRGAFIMQQDLEEFEKELSVFLKAKYSIGVANATDGMELALMAIGINKGDEIICSSHTMLATASAIIMSGGIPVPVDIGNDNLIDPDAISDAINTKTVGIMPTQLNGRTCNMDAIEKIANKHSLFIVEDAAQSLGSKFKGKNAGTFGKISSISFFPAKVLGSLGDGGAVVTQDKEIYHALYQLHDHGRDVDGVVKRWGRNSRLDNLNAAILSFKLKNYNEVIVRRREIARQYNNYLKVLDELKLPEPPSETSDHYDVFQNYEIEADQRDSLKEFLFENGIGTLIQWGGKGFTILKILDF